MIPEENFGSRYLLEMRDAGGLNHIEKVLSHSQDLNRAK